LGGPQHEVCPSNVPAPALEGPLQGLQRRQHLRAPAHQRTSAEHQRTSAERLSGTKEVVTKKKKKYISASTTFK